MLDKSGPPDTPENVSDKPDRMGAAHPSPASSPTVPPRYRLDIEGLRGVAIALAIIFHLSPTSIDAGFIGVDIFFVISGYVITWAMLDSWNQGRFTYAAFFIARARRLAPAYITVLLSVLLFGLLCLSPREMQLLAEASGSASIFSSNIYFWRQLDYFEPAAIERPLLHTWSLGIEGQFYLFFPLIAAGLLARKLEPLPATIALIAISYGLAVWGSSAHPVPTFYLLPTRLWELLAGSAVAQVFHARAEVHRPVLDTVAGALGAALVLGSALLLSNEDGWPNAWAIVPVIGTALLLCPGGPSPIRRVLQTDVLTFLGRISYPLYLWHWPLLSYLFVIRQGKPSLAEDAAMIGVAIALATLTTRYVEHPVRRTGLFSGRQLIAAAGAGVALLAGVSALIWFSGGVPQRLPTDIRELVRAEIDINPLIYDCAAQAASGAPPPYPECWQRRTQASAPVWIVWGDSHAAALAPGVADYLESAGIDTYLASSAACPPMPGLKIQIEQDGRDIFERGLPTCLAYNQHLLQWALSDPAVQGVVLAARWALWESGLGYGVLEARSPFTIRLESDLGVGADAIRHSLIETSTRLREAGKTVVLMGQVPETPHYIPQCLARNALPLPVRTSCGSTAQDARARLAPSDALLRSVSAASGALTILPSEILCDVDACAYSGDSGIYYFDDDHLSVVGARKLATHFTWLSSPAH